MVHVSYIVGSILLFSSLVFADDGDETTPPGKDLAGAYSISTFDQIKLANLTSDACFQVYIANITTCQIQDFLSTVPCSSTCINGLKGIQLEAQAQCAGIPLNTTSILKSFVNGQGVQLLCGTTKTGTCITSVVNKGASAPTSSGDPTLNPSPEIQEACNSLQISRGAIIGMVFFVIFAITAVGILSWMAFRKRKVVKSLG